MVASSPDSQPNAIKSLLSNDQSAILKGSDGKELKYDAASLKELFEGAIPQPDWIFEGLIHAGDQVVLAGPPKIGKSLLGVQLALSAAKGGTHFLRPDFKTSEQARRVLVFSLEMNRPMIAERLRKLDAKLQSDAPKIPLNFVFSVGETDSLDVLNFDSLTESKAKKAGKAKLSDDGENLKKIIRHERPDLVVFDTLVRVHALDENNNVAMSHLLKFLRKICSLGDKPGERLAHVLVHHTRKENSLGNGSSNRDANAVRGAGAIHSEADLVLTLSDWDRKGVVMMSVSARRVSLPDAIFLERKSLEFSETNRPIGTRQMKAKQLAAALWETFQSTLPGTGLTLPEITTAVSKRDYEGLSEENLRKTYIPKLKRFMKEIKPGKKDKDKTFRFALNEGVKEESFYNALGARKEP